MATRNKDRLANLLIRASAGTGKTYQLSQRYLTLLQRGVPPERILATTFTRKAAAEILDRIVLKLAAAAIDEQKRKQLGQEIQVPRFSENQCLTLLESLLKNLHRLRISTLDSLFGQIARAFSLELGLPPGWRIADEAEEAETREAAIDAVLSREESSAVLELTHLLTKGETKRGVAELIRSTVISLQSLYQEAPKQAWTKIQRSKQLDPAELERAIDKLRELPVAEKRLASAREKDCEPAIAGDWDAFLSKGLAKKILDDDLTYYSKPIPDEVVKLYRPLIDQAKAVLVNRVVAQTEGSYRLLERFDQQRRKKQQESRGVRFDDITQVLARTLAERDTDSGSSPVQAMDADAFSMRLDSSVSHLLLDEFQDTSPNQWRALSPFVSGATRLDEPSSFFCVGDVKQAIYGWRGGVAEIFDAIERQVAGVETQPLTHSYRSSRAVIELVNRVFEKACEHPRLDRCEASVKAWCEKYQMHSTERKDWPGYATVRTASAVDDQRKSQDVVLETACNLIAELHQKSPATEIGVLVRRNVTVSHIVHMLRMRGLPASEEGGNPLTDSAAVQLVLSLLRLADHPGDLVTRFHLAESPLGPCYELTCHDDAAAAHRLSSDLRRQLQTDGFGPVVQHAAAILREHCTGRDRQRLAQLVEKAFAFPNPTSLRADEFIRRIEYDRVREPVRSAIRVMTVHQSKGLEFETVVLPELDYDLIPQTPAFVVERDDPTGPITAVCRYANASIQKLMGPSLRRMFELTTDRQVSESLCVLYVALTRAIHALHIVISPSKANEQSFPRSIAGIVRSATYGNKLAPPNMMLYASGDPDWKVPEVDHGVAAEPEAPTTAPAKIQFATKPRRRGLERVSPSSLEGGTRISLKHLLDDDGRAAALRGTLFHACFEQIHWLDEGMPDDERLGRIIGQVMQREGALGDASKWLREFRDCLARPIIDSVLRRQSYARLKNIGFPKSVANQLERRSLKLVVENERPVAAIESGRLLSGSIDRLVLLFDGDQIVGADIIDFKTDIMRGAKKAAVRERVEFYRPQIDAYRNAIMKMTGLPVESIVARLVFVSEGICELVPHGLPEASEASHVDAG